MQSLINNVFRSTGSFPRRTPTRKSHVDFKIQSAYYLYEIKQAASRSHAKLQCKCWELWISQPNIKPKSKLR